METATRIGRYRIEEKLGRGGMGDVYLGYDETLERKVALKCIKADDRLDEEARARFLREAKVLSQLGHPDICQIHDYLEGEKNDYLVLELLSGRTLAESIKENDLSPRRKLEIAARIAGVLEAAHQKGIIHRDLKPDNVIVDENGGMKVLDFGLARQLSEEDPAVPCADTPGRRTTHRDETMAIYGSGKGTAGTGGLTTAGVIMGTLGYMSPEQARGEEVTTSSDMYSFGILLQELFTGRFSFDREMDFHTLLEKNQKGEREIVHAEDPDIAGLIRELTQIEPAARLTAREASRKIAFIIEKPARRRKRMIAAAAIAVLVFSTVASTFFWIRSLRSEKRAREEATAARSVSRFLVKLFEVPNPNEAKGKTITAKEVLDKGVGDIQNELVGQPKIRSELMQTMGSVYSNLGLYREAFPLLEKSLQLAETSFGGRSPEVAGILADMGNVNEKEGKYAEAEKFYNGSLEIYQGRPEEKNGENVIELMNNVADIWQKQGKYKEALGLYGKALAAAEKRSGPKSILTARCLGNMGSVNDILGNFEEAEKLYARTYEIFRANYGDTHTEMAILLNNMAAICESKGQLDKAEDYYIRCLEMKEKLYGKEHDSLAVTLNNLGYIYSDEQKFDKAEEAWTRALSIWKNKFGEEHPYVALGYYNMGRVCKQKKDYPGSEANYLKALAIFQKVYGRDSNECSMACNGLGSLYRIEGKDKEAEVAYLDAVRIGEVKIGLGHADVLKIALNLVDFYREKRQFLKAEALLGKLLRIWEGKTSDREKGLKSLYEICGKVYSDEGRKKEAEEFMKKAGEIK